MSLAMPLSLGQRLVRERLRLNWSQEEVARALGITARSVNRWEHDKSVPHPHYRQQLCLIFQISSETLFGTVPFTETTSSAPSSLWNIPYRRNPFFTGREEVLIRLHNTLHSGNVAALTQVISGLEGIGKTHTAVEYAYRFRDDYSAVLWVRAETRESLLADVVTLATLLDLSEKDEQDQARIVEAVKHWLDEQTNWLLVLDNVEDFTILVDVLPSQSKGHIVLTTRAQATGAFAQGIRLNEMEREEGALLLLRRAKFLKPYIIELEEVSEALQVMARDLSQMLGGLPLALDQAGAYIEETGCTLLEYKEYYQMRQAALLDRRGTMGGDHPQSVSITLSFCFEKVKSAHPAAGELLILCAFLAADIIPEEIFTEGGSELGPILQPVTIDPLLLNDALAILRKYSLLSRNPETKTFTIHRLVQAVLKGRMNEEAQYQWAERTVRAVNKAFPDIGQASQWPRCQYFLSHAQICAMLIEQHQMLSLDAGQLLYKAGMYLRELGLYAQAEEQLSKSHVLLSQVLGAIHPCVAQSLDTLALLYYNQGRYSEAESLYQHALMLREQCLGPQHVDLAETFNDLAVLYRDQGRYSEAEFLYQRALEICEQQRDPH